MGSQGWRRVARWGLIVAWSATTAQAGTRLPARDTSSLQTRGADVGKAYLLEYYQELPQPSSGDSPERWTRRLRVALDRFREQVQARYTEGTLQRLLDCPTVEARRAAVLALGMTGTMESNAAVAVMLHDEDPTVRQLTADALWSLWFRAGTENQNRELRRLVAQGDLRKALTDLDVLIVQAPDFAEAYNQRAIVYFRLKDYPRSAADCEAVIRQNPYHFGALAGMGQCYMKLNKPRAALKAFREAFRIHPGLEGVEETIHFLENPLGEEGKTDDRK